MEYIACLVWAAVFVACIIIEGLTAEIVSIWFAVGSFVSIIIAYFFPTAYLLQFIVFLLLSVLSLLIARPLLKDRLAVKKSKISNKDRCVGAKALVTEDIDNALGTGRVSVDGKDWAARSIDSKTYKKDEFVYVEKIEGVKLIVKGE
jgi:membrane protein implicated in regulation of membrane protease activity